MASAAVSAVVVNLTNLLIKEAKFLHGVSEKVEKLRDELQWMLCFLQDAEGREKDERVRKWVEEIRDAAYDAEDLIESHALRVASSSRNWWRNSFARSASIFHSFSALHSLGMKMMDITSRLEDLNRNLQSYGIQEMPARSINDLLRFDECQRELRKSYSHIEDQDVVGLKDDIRKLVRILVGKKETSHSYGHSQGPGGCRVIGICGMGGLGKTTLAKKLYHHKEVRQHFNGFAWAFISQQCSKREIWEAILLKLISPTGEEHSTIKQMTDDQVAKKIYELLRRKRCLVVLDDIWFNATCDLLKPAFPEMETESKILLTTRNRNVALRMDSACFHHDLGCLTDEVSWQLFERIAIRRRTQIASYKWMEEEGLSIVRCCGGLPLAIKVIGGILSTKDTKEEWESVRQNIKPLLRKGEGQEADKLAVIKLLGLSYDHLPYHLKPCFLHLSHFPEDYEIPAKSLTQLWVAEGLIKFEPQNEKETTPEKLAYDYLCGLAERCILQVEKRGSIRRIKTCRMHDLMRELCITKASEEKFLEFVDLHDKTQTQDLYSLSGRFRRLSLSTDNGYRLIPNIEESNIFLLRSLYIFGLTVPEFGENVMFSLKSFRMIRVLKLERYCLVGSGLQEIENLIHLRYLSLRGSMTDADQLTTLNVGKLKCLTTLILEVCNKVWSVPNVLWKMRQLKHLHLPYFVQADRCKCSLKHLPNLMTIINLPEVCCCWEDLAKLTKLTKLRIIRCTSNVTGWIGALESRDIVMNRVSSFEILDPFGIQELNISYLCSSQIRKLYLRVPLVVLSEVCHHFPNVVKLVLDFTKLEEDPMEKLEKMPSLKKLYILKRAFIGEEMTCSDGGFPQLETLKVTALPNLKKWVIERGSMPQLKDLQINNCPNLCEDSDCYRLLTILGNYQEY